MFCFGVFGIYFVLMKGLVNDFFGKVLFLIFDLESLLFILVILFNFLGFEVVIMFVSDMENFKK